MQDQNPATMPMAYIGTKVVMARPMSEDENNERLGSLRRPKTFGRDGYEVTYADEYVAWSPADVFDKAYSLINECSFGKAIDMAMQGHRIVCNAWEIQVGMWVAISCPHDRQTQAEHFWSPHNRAYAHSLGGEATVAAAFTLRGADGKIYMGWTPSTAEMMATWTVLATLHYIPK